MIAAIALAGPPLGHGADDVALERHPRRAHSSTGIHSSRKCSLRRRLGFSRSQRAAIFAPMDSTAHNMTMFFEEAELPYQLACEAGSTLTC